MSIPCPPPPDEQTSPCQSGSQGKKIRIGICAMSRKATSKPMRAIMSKIVDYYKDWLEYFIFPETVIINDPVDHGILVEHNDHIEVNGMVFNKPFVEKPISAEDHNIYIYYPSSVGGGSQRLFRKINNRSSWYSPVSEVRKTGSYIYEDFIPADGTDVKSDLLCYSPILHSIYDLFGQCKLYEFEVYAVGPFYAHAEARKAPGLDGKVERDANGKEQTVCGFDLLRANGKSFVCDVNGFSFVKTSTKYYEDTAKILGNTIMRRLATTMSVRIPYQMPLGEHEAPPLLDLGLGGHLGRSSIVCFSNNFYCQDDPPFVSTPSGKLMELRCVLAVIRHGDRTPKQKMKVIVHDERFFALFKKYDGFKKNEIKMKRPNQLMEVLELARQILAEHIAMRNTLLLSMEEHEDSGNDCHRLEHELEQVEDAIKRWDQMRAVLEMYGHFSGINRKVQLKYLKAREFRVGENDETTQQGPALVLILKWGGELTTAGNLQAEALGKLFRTLYPGIRRADGKSSPEDVQGLGFLRLHSTYRHDLKIYASDEGRVQMTAAAFAKGMLALEGELTPILMQMVKSANTDGLLDDDCHARDFQSELKGYLHQALQVDREWTPEDYQALNPDGLKSINNAMEFIRNPKKMCHEIAGYVEQMCNIIKHNKHSKPHRTLYLNETWDLAEQRWGKELREFRRENKLGDVEYDISKIPDIYDNIKYDMEHNPDLCINNEGEFERMYVCVKNMADIVVPQEYGIRKDNKICVAQRVCTPLLKKIRNDLHRCIECSEEDESQTRLDPRQEFESVYPSNSSMPRFFINKAIFFRFYSRASQGIATPLRHVRTRLYFTSESHIHTLMNLIRYGGLCSVDDKKWQRAMNFLSGVTEFNYMTQVVLMVYEDSRADSTAVGMDRFHIELLFSPGLYPCFLTEKERIYESRLNKTNGMTKSQSREGNCNGSISPLSTESVNDKNENPTSIFVAVPKISSDDVSVSSTNENQKAAEASGLLSSSSKTHNQDSEDDLNDAHSVNLVALDEVNSKQYAAEDKGSKRQRNMIGCEKASEEGDKPRIDLDDWRHDGGVIKSPSEVSIGDDDYQNTVGHGRGKWAKDLVDETKRAMNSIKEVEEKPIEYKESTSLPKTDQIVGADDKSRRTRFPYRFKHHTVNLLTGGSEVQNRLISTNVLMGKCGGDHLDKNRRQTYIPGPAVMSTAVIARSSSAPRLQTYKAEDDISVGEIKRFWPPLRSLETLHDSLSFTQFDQFLAHLLSSRTPLPSPPKTPLLISAEDTTETNLKGLREEVERLKALGINDKKLL
ncbi:histidine acid phosphatase [Dictyocaulus viviparus]|uniref:Inositol hexakisphosphate and diphosphoinositol-pentakisphosphate kinase n=1 Tax=Dictyocaulus viviparus TaxID=29172 RepID=A0A0D8Y936_DICVI|nr:histidine acid phosphatase [Dictyocaulus viviparus]